MPGRAVIALDGFGAEQGFGVLAEGARSAAAEGIGLRVFGPPERLGLGGVDGIEVIPTEVAIGNEEDAVSAVRAREDASVVRAAADVADGPADALVSVGSTGATMAAATFGLRRLKGVQRPALAVRLPVPGRPVLFLDAGANVEVRAQHLVQFAFLGAAFSEAVLAVAEPTVGLLSVGEESGKGTEAVAEAHDVLAASEGIRFLGNIEGRDVPAGAADVVVTDGFTGNVSLKLLEGTIRTLLDALREEIAATSRGKVGGLLIRPAARSLRNRLDPDTYGGAYLLGLRGLSVIAHGNSSRRAIASAIRLAARGVEHDVVDRLAARLPQRAADPRV